MIKLSINHTEISTSCLETLVEGNVNSIFVEFSFSSEWEALGKTVFFSNGTVAVSVLLTDNVCAIPWEVLSCPGDLLVSLRGVGDGGSFVLCTENASLGKVEESLADDDADEPESHTVDAIDELIAEMAELMASGGVAGEDGKSAYELAVDSGFDGSLQQWLASLHGTDGTNGVNGINGTDGADGYTPVKGVDYWTQADIAEIGSHTDSVLSTHTGNNTVHVTSSEKQTWNGKQSKITASGLLKGDGSGGVTAAVDGTDYLSPETNPAEIYTAVYGETTYAEITAAVNSGKKVQCKRTQAGTTYIYDLTIISDTIIRFGQLSNSKLFFVSVNTSDSWTEGTVEYSNLAKVNEVVAKAQGVAHAGEFLAVGSDGNVTTANLPLYDGGVE